VVYALAPSRKDGQVIWPGRTTGSSIGRATVERPGKTSRPSSSSLGEGEHSSSGPVRRGHRVSAINTLRLDDLRPHILRTHDGGKTWQEIVRGLPEGGS